jgi:dihydroorotase
MADLLIENGRVARVGTNLSENCSEVFNARGFIVAPGFIDLHTHLREPGEEYKETIASGAAAAVAGGFTSICSMANTKPVNDNAMVTNYIIERARAAGFAQVFPIGAVTRKCMGKELADMAEMKHAGVVAVSDDNQPIMDSQVMRLAMEYARDHDLLVVENCHDVNLSAGGVINESYYSALLGLKGISHVAEESHVSRDIMLAKLTGARVHIAHVSTAGSVEILRDAKQRLIAVTCDVTPHHLALTDAAVVGFDTNFKIDPPLRSEEDRNALIKALLDGTIDAIATDHSPHHGDEKMLEYDCAPFGVIGLETALGVGLTVLYHTGLVSLTRIVELFSSGPARVLSLQRGTLSVGAVADVTIFDSEYEWMVDPVRFKSKSRNTPFTGWRLRGSVAATFIAGREVFRADWFFPRSQT